VNKAALHKNELGYGIYTVSDISRLLKLEPGKVRRYLKNYWDEGLISKLYKDSYSWKNSRGNKAVNFYMLIEFFSFFKLKEIGVKTSTILKARLNIASELRTAYPFASAGLLSDGKKIWYEVENDIVNADGSCQTNFVNIIKAFTEKIDFGQDKLANRFWPDGKLSSVVVDPHHQFGQPVINGTNINTEMLFSMYSSGESIESIRDLYELSEKEIIDAINFYQKAA